MKTLALAVTLIALSLVTAAASGKKPSKSHAVTKVVKTLKVAPKPKKIVKKHVGPRTMGSVAY